MTIEVPIYIDLSDKMPADKAAEARSKTVHMIHDILLGVRKIYRGFLWLPFKKCVIIEGTEDKISHGREITFEKLEEDFLKWCDTIIHLISSRMVVEEMGCVEITVTFSDADMHYGWLCQIYYPTDDTYVYKCMPTSEDCFSEFAEEHLLDRSLNVTLGANDKYE